jgi:glutamyl-tRNA synthetase
MSTPGRMPPRVRIAPSPTGDPHVGTAYIALFNYAFARRHGGRFVLRIEDTDQERYTPGSEQAILEALRWLGLTWDEGPDVGGEHGPYRQSERLAHYREQLERLLEEDAAFGAAGDDHGGPHKKAYRCFCTRERLETLRKQQMAAKASFLGYDGCCRALDPGEAKRRAAAGEPHVVRLRVPRGEGATTIVADRLRGDVAFAHSEIDDQVLLKSDGFPTYHLANVVDDHLMGITHVIRGEEWLSSTPKHVLLYAAFGWEAPEWYHLGLLRNADKSKLSKRKNPVSIIHYRELGFLPSTFLNFLATLGFSLGDDRERFTLQEMVDAFDWSRVSTGGPVFDPRKLEAFNADDIRALSPAALYEHMMTHVLRPERLQAMLSLAHERLTRLDDFVPYVSFFFGASLDYSSVLPQVRIKGRTHAQSAKLLRVFIEEIEKDTQARAFTPQGLEAFAREFCERQGWKARDLFTLLRIAVTGRIAAPPLFDTMALVGKDRARMRLRDLVDLLQALPE